MDSSLVDDLKDYYAALPPLSTRLRWDLALGLLAIEHGGGQAERVVELFYQVTDLPGLQSLTELQAALDPPYSGPYDPDEVTRRYAVQEGKTVARAKASPDPGPWYIVQGEEGTQSITDIRDRLRGAAVDFTQPRAEALALFAEISRKSVTPV